MTSTSATRSFAASLVLAMTLSLVVGVAAVAEPDEIPPPHVCDEHQGGATFPDAPGSGHRYFIDCLAELGVVEGMDDGLFRPAADVSRGQLASFVVRSVELATDEELDASGDPFPDVAVGSTHGQTIIKLYNAEIIRGYQDGTFRPRASVTRDQTARYVVNALELVRGEDLATSGVSFPDVAAGSQYAVDIDKLVTAGVVSGFVDGTFGPRLPVTRGQMTRFVGNALNLMDPVESLDPIDAIIADMTLEQKVGQLFWTRAHGASAHDDSFASENQDDYGVDTPAEVVEKYHLGGVLYFAWAGNTDDPQQIAELSNGLQEVALDQPSGVPLSLSIDQEGGIVARMLEPATVFPGNMALGATRDTELAAEQWRIQGAELRAVGVNTNFAPVVDVNTNPVNPVIGVRSFAEDPALVGELGAIAAQQLQDEGVSATLKHFPGHGDTEVDSHFGLPIVTYDRETLDEVHLAPFAEAIDAGTDAIMTAHIIIEALDPDLPATLSPEVMTGVLREEMGFDGVLVTDSLDMAGVREFWGDDVVPVLALQAGSDVLLNPPEMDVAYDAVVDAVESGELTEQRIEQSVRRILQMKQDRGMFDDPFTTSDAVDDTVGIPEHLAVADQIAQQATTLVRNEDATLPLDASATPELLVVGPVAGDPVLIGDELDGHGFDTTVQTTDANPTAEQRQDAVDAAADAEVVVVTANNAWVSEAQQQLVHDLIETDTPVVVIGTRDAYDINRMPEVDAFVATYGNRAVSLRAAAGVLVGDVRPGGALPVTIPTADGTDTLYPYGHGLDVEP